MSLVKHSIEAIPFPYFLMDEEFNILSVSEEVNNHFPRVTNFLDLVDYGSKNKVKRFMNPVIHKTKLEINLLTKHQPISLYDVYIQWDQDKRLNVFCIEKQNYVEQIQSFLSKLEKQLSDENLSLLEKKEELERSLKKMEQIVTEHDSLANLGKLVTGIAEELRRPLISIKGFLQLLKPHLIDIGKEHYVNVALDEINQANHLIFQYLSTTMPSSPMKEQNNIHKVITEVIQSTEKEAHNLNCEIKYNKEHILPVINMDTKQIKQVFLNLLRNSMEAIEDHPSRESGHIQIKTNIVNHSIEVSFQDNGIGMNKETVKNIFTPFFTTKDKRAGIGLSVSAHIVEIHGGKIEVSSTPQEGAIITVILPLNV
ncbi:two-component system sensor histidine kinase NtrB [Bacillus sp. PS06]|uniref:two-component system sensor histidine kinase NtrB n=1 Tax=Bacillus sp. PS06 TaxID=2764176 RepID=UPI0017863493|nr:ATP-binding protein [Bacillus sp. PS06]MBD8070156.1 GHKL domain-containing protein [Bacillus sp. PS06]